MAPINQLICTLLQLFTITTITHSAQIPSTFKPSAPAIKEPTVRIQCMSGYMLITIKDAPLSPDDDQFSGMIYPKGLSKNSTCLTEYRHHSGPLKYKLPLRSCNTMSKETNDNGFEFFNTIVLQPHLKLVTDLGRGYHVRCRYKSREAAAAAKFVPKTDDAVETVTGDSLSHGASDHIYTEAAAEAENKLATVSDRREHGRALGQKSRFISDNELPMPPCHMKIFSKGIIAENVKIGDPLTMKISIDKQENYGLHVMECLVRDGLGWGEQNLLKFGCPLDGEIMGEFEYSEGQDEAKVSFPAHKFPYTASVYYECIVKLCHINDSECKRAPDCANPNSRTRRDTKDKEDDEGQPATIELYSGLYVNENAEIIEGADDSVFAEKTPDDALCISQRSFAIAISIAGLILMLAVVAAVLCIMARRRSKTVSNSGSSIYSGPYTNTAFSHSS